MNIRKFVVFAVILGVVSFGLATAVQAALTDTPNSLKGATQAAVSFPHKVHNDKGYFKDKCTDCHTAATGGALKVPLADVKGIKHVYHDTCITCHKTMAKGPTGCKDCHKK